MNRVSRQVNTGSWVTLLLSVLVAAVVLFAVVRGQHQDSADVEMDVVQAIQVRQVQLY